MFLINFINLKRVKDFISIYLLKLVTVFPTNSRKNVELRLRLC